MNRKTPRAGFTPIDALIPRGIRGARRSGFSFVEVMIALAITIVLVVIVYMLVFSSTQHVQTHATAVDLENQCRQIMDEVGKDLRSTVLNGSFTQGPVDGINGWQVGVWRVSRSLSFTPLKQNPADPTYNPFSIAADKREYDPAVTWQTTSLEPVNGADDNNDALIDEADITRSQITVPPTTMRPTRRGTSRNPSTPLGPAPTGGSVGTPPQWGTAMPPAITFSTVTPVGQPTPIENQIFVTITLQGVDSRGRRMTRSLTSSFSLRND